MHVDKIFPKLPAPHKRLISSGLLYETINTVVNAAKQLKNIYIYVMRPVETLGTERTAVYRNKRNLDKARKVCTQEEIQWKKKRELNIRERHIRRRRIQEIGYWHSHGW